MANQVPSRSWFRFASLRSVAAPPSALAQDPRPSLVQPSRINSSPPPSERGSVPTSPAQKLPVQSSSSFPTSPLQNGSLSTSSSVSSPAQKESPPPSSASSPAKVGTSPSTKQVVQTVMQSNKVKPSTPQSISSSAKGETMPRESGPSTKQVVQTLMQTHKAKPITPPPSPLTLPPAQLKANYEVKPKIPEEAESKSVILQKRIEKPKQWGNDNSWETQTNHNEKQNGNDRKSGRSEDSPMQFITIAGENRGAYMELIQSPKKHEFGDNPNYIYRTGVSKTENGESGSWSSDEGNVKKKENKNNRRTKSSHPMAAFMNSNVQCVNNSLLFNASCNHHNPVPRLSLTRKPFDSGGFHLKEIANGRPD